MSIAELSRNLKDGWETYKTKCHQETYTEAILGSEISTSESASSPMSPSSSVSESSKSLQIHQ